MDSLFLVRSELMDRLTLPASEKNKLNLMIINLKDIKLKISRNENNRFWNPRGQFWNITEIIINDEWYKCGLIFIKKNNKYYIQFNHPMIVEEKTNIIKEVFCEDIYKEIEVSKLKFNLIKYLENTHYINRRSYNIRKSIYDRKRTILIFSLALIPSAIFYTINVKYDNIIIHLIADNTWVQTLIFFITISGFINIFHPFSIRKEIDKNDIQNITKETLENEKANEEIKRRATF